MPGVLMPGVAVPAALCAAALVAPLPLHLVALAVFGLPHVVWELAFLRSRYGRRWPRGWWAGLLCVLALQAAARGAQAAGIAPALLVQGVDLATLALLGALVAAAPRGTGLAARCAGAAGALGLVALLLRGDVAAALLWIALLHNFTPMLLAWDLAREDRRQRPLARRITVMFALPLVIAVLPLPDIAGIAAGAVVGGTTAGADGATGGVLAAQLPFGATPALLSAVALAQVLHYYCVIRLLPAAEARRSGRAMLSPQALTAALVATFALAGYFWSDPPAARALYAVAAGAHAWLEWPVLLMAWLGASAGARTLSAQAGERLQRGDA